MPWDKVQHGTIEGNDITFKTNDKGETLIADGITNDKGELKTDADLRANHDHYGSGNGPNNNGTERGAYNGPGSK